MLIMNLSLMNTSVMWLNATSVMDDDLYCEKNALYSFNIQTLFVECAASSPPCAIRYIN